MGLAQSIGCFGSLLTDFAVSLCVGLHKLVYLFKPKVTSLLRTLSISCKLRIRNVVQAPGSSCTDKLQTLKILHKIDTASQQFLTILVPICDL